jgi:hypothetical protein
MHPETDAVSADDGDLVAHLAGEFQVSQARVRLAIATTGPTPTLAAVEAELRRHPHGDPEG